jgi:hypothetical protein
LNKRKLPISDLVISGSDKVIFLDSRLFQW